MATTIADNGVFITITIDGDDTDVLKDEIERVRIIKTNIIKLDLGKDPLHNVFIPYAEVTAPVTAGAKELRDAIRAMLNSGSGQSATETKQNEQITLLTAVKDTLETIQTHAKGLDDKVFLTPLIVDDSGAGVLYNGYALPGTAQNSPTWAIERIQKKDDMDVHTWANGNRNFTNSWLDREALTYA
jgi:hypothetical protein